MNTSNKGKRSEAMIMKLFTDNGMYCMQSSASKGLWDIVGFMDEYTILTQVKSNDWPGKAELSGLVTFSNCPTKTIKLVAVINDGGHGKKRTIDLGQVKTIPASVIVLPKRTDYFVKFKTEIQIINVVPWIKDLI